MVGKMYLRGTVISCEDGIITIDTGKNKVFSYIKDNDKLSLNAGDEGIFIGYPKKLEKDGVYYNNIVELVSYISTTNDVAVNSGSVGGTVSRPPFIKGSFASVEIACNSSFITVSVFGDKVEAVKRIKKGDVVTFLSCYFGKSNRDKTNSLVCNDPIIVGSYYTGKTAEKASQDVDSTKVESVDEFDFGNITFPDIDGVPSLN